MFAYFWVCHILTACFALTSSTVTSGGFSSLWLRAPHRSALSCCGRQAPRSWPSGLAALGLCSRAMRALVALQRVESSWTRDRARVPCISRWIPNCATSEGPNYFLKVTFPPNFSVSFCHQATGTLWTSPSFNYLPHANQLSNLKFCTSNPFPQIPNQLGIHQGNPWILL